MTTPDEGKLVIGNEQVALEALRAALTHEIADAGLQLEFDHWPVVSIKLEGEGYNSTITPDIAESLVNLQHAMNRAYARAIHQTTNARSLTAEERRSIQFKAKVEQGSSLIKVDLGVYAEKLATALAGKMDPNDIIITVLGVALIAGGTLTARAYLKHRSEASKAENETKHRLALSQEETRRLEIVANALAAKPQLEYARQDFDDVRQDVLKSTGDATNVTLQGIRLSREEARVISLTPRSESEAVQLNGHYQIQKIDWQQPDQVRLWLRGADTGAEFQASFKGAALDDEQKEKLKSAEWARKPLYMAVNGTRLRGEITTAAIVSVAWQKEVPSREA